MNSIAMDIPVRARLLDIYREGAAETKVFSALGAIAG